MALFIVTCLAVSVYEISAADLGSARCPNGSHRTPSGDCQKVTDSNPVDPTSNTVAIPSPAPTSNTVAIPSPAPTSNTVIIAPGSSLPSNNKSFEPNTLSVYKEVVVTWINQDTTLHTVTSGNPQGGNSGAEFDSSYLAAGKAFEHTFLVAGTYDYYCTLHPFMTGTVVVADVVNPNDNTEQTDKASSNTPVGRFGIQYSNYTSDKYQIKFQYPSDWQVTEKANRFAEGADIEIQKSGGGFILILTSDELVKFFGSSNLRTAVYKSFRESIGYDVDYQFRAIEEPSFSTIDNQSAGTFVVSSKKKYEDYPLVWGNQKWLVFVGNRGYFISYSATTDVFDNPENTESRDHFIQSIKFLGQPNVTNTNNSSSRFAE